jgi:hypothetical protein
MKPPSSIFGSDPRSPRRWIAILLGLCAVFYLCVEVGTLAFLRFISLTDKRVRREHAAAVDLRAGTDGAVPLLVVGNSLVEFGVDFPRLGERLQGRYAPQRYMMESSAYLDWYYGLRHLFRQGARPPVVVLVLSGRQLIAPDVVAGDDFASYLMDTRDLFRVSGEIDADRTRISNLLFANLSPFYGTRTHIRTRVLSAVFPRFEDLTGQLHPARAQVPDDETTAALIRSRVVRLAALCQEYGARLILDIPPTNASDDDGARLLREAGRATGVEVHVPADFGRFVPGDYRDGFHMNAGGARKFTDALAAQILAEPTPQR